MMPFRFVQYRCHRIATVADGIGNQIHYRSDPVRAQSTKVSPSRTRSTWGVNSIRVASYVPHHHTGILTISFT
ncbi:hypothetical protein X943_003352 [Babesia divergens]|uniref:Uncharacterized protein n=1 Tax=Babesia divergens TaxID=32595 RepID=A0AAD9GDJ0_BABDI|nr:hypothetical protein X943_003352 [Babesia divergens]